jgi:antitoxin component YwqK of YwqJK toxin-antitoxin module
MPGNGIRICNCALPDGNVADGPSVVLIDPGGRVAEKGNIAKRMRTGEWLYFGDDGKPYMRALIKDGKSVAASWTWEGKPEKCPLGMQPWVDIPVNNSPGRTVTCRDEHPQSSRVGVHREWHHSGARKGQGQFQGDWIPVGLFKSWYPDGRLALEGTFVDGTRTGDWTWFDHTGNVLHRERYDDQERVVGVSGIVIAGWREPDL